MPNWQGVSDLLLDSALRLSKTRAKAPVEVGLARGLTEICAGLEVNVALVLTVNEASGPRFSKKFNIITILYINYFGTAFA
jgi:hypothetical protein